MSSKLDRILEKLRKLMNLQQSAASLGNEGEANAAAAGINRLLLEYNLSMKDIPEHEKLDNPIVCESLSVKKTIPGPWFEQLVVTVCHFNFCKNLLTRSLNRTTLRYAKDEIQIIGRKNNVEIANYLISFLENAFVQAGRKSYPEYRIQMLKMGIKPKTEAMYKRSFLVGCVYGLRRKFEDQKQQFASDTDVTALVKASDAELDAFLSEMHINGTARPSSAKIDEAASMRGIREGYDVEIHKGIYADSVSENFRLEKK